MVDRAGQGEGLLDRDSGQGGDQTAEFGQRGAVAVDIAVRLFQRDAGGNPQRKLLGVTVAQITGQDQHALGVYRLPQFRFAFDVDDAARTGIDGGADPRRRAEAAAAHLQHGQTVDLAHRFAVGID